jgi:PTS system N-acetylglucosamine-specific IIC component
MAPLVLGAAPEGGKDPVINYGVLAGIVMGLTTAWLWQKFHRTTLPDWLGFFAGRRLVPILTSFAAIIIGVVMALIYPFFNSGLTAVGNTVADNTVVGSGIYGMLNRLLIPLGLHHILNSIVWFIIGDYNGAHGDLNRFFAGDPSAGVFMTGFFPIMMFALPAAALAIWHEAKPSQKKIVGGVMLSTGLTAFLTGITEPLEFSFMFVAWPLYLVHAVLTGTSMMLVNFLGIHHGFGFSAGAIDYLLNFGIAQNPLWLVPIGLGYAAVFAFRSGLSQPRRAGFSLHRLWPSSRSRRFRLRAPWCGGSSAGSRSGTPRSTRPRSPDRWAPARAGSARFRS